MSNTNSRQSILSIYHYIIKNISSCTERSQLQGCVNLISLFEQKYSKHIAFEILLLDLNYLLGEKGNELVITDEFLK